MTIRIVFRVIILGAALLLSVPVDAGNLDAPGTPGNSATAMWTLKDVYDVLNTRATNVSMRTTTFSEPVGTASNGTMHTLNDVMALVTNRAAVPKTGQSNSYADGDDGTKQLGVASPTPRFADNGDGTVTDNMTGLVWLKNANAFGQRFWPDAVADCNALANGMHGLADGSSAGDWRLPNIMEYFSLFSFQYANPPISNAAGTGQWTEGDPFTGIQANLYWSSTTTAGYVGSAWGVPLGSGAVRLDYTKTTGARYVWPVRDGD